MTDLESQVFTDLKEVTKTEREKKVWVFNLVGVCEKKNNYGQTCFEGFNI